MNSYAKLSTLYKRIKSLRNISGILGWDAATQLPSGSAKFRGEDSACLESMIHEMITSKEFGDAINAVDKTTLNKFQLAGLKKLVLNRDEALATSTELVERATRTATETEMIWREARKNNDFKLLAPHLQKNLDVVREIAQSRGSYFNCDPYDSLLSIYDHGRKAADLEKIVTNLRAFLPNFIGEVVEKQSSRKVLKFEDGAIFPADKQKELGVYCMQNLGFNFDMGRIDTSTHPFCGGNSKDVRITSRYDVNDFYSGLMGIIHETGHALYEQNLPDNELALGESCGLAVHESQSLFMEIQVARRREFIEFLLPKIKEVFGVGGSAWCTVDNIYNMFNAVKPSLIRVDADEVTYPAHVILRFNLEKELISGNLPVSDLPDAWRSGMKELLGIEPKTDSEGCMQDIHWPMGAFGYFPTYMMGSIIASQLFKKAQEETPSLLSSIKNGDFKPVTGWLGEKIHSQGSLYGSADELIKAATGKAPDVECYKEYLRGKYL